MALAPRLSAQQVLNEARSLAPLQYSFPKKRIKNVRHKIIMNFYKFNFQGAGNPINNTSLERQISERSTASIILPVPIKIIENYNAQYASVDNMNLVNGGLSALLSRLGLSGTAQGLLSGVASLGLNLAGMAINPYTTIRFKGMPLRRHNFHWKLSPESEEDTNEIERIIRAISIRMHPESAGFLGQEVLLRYPELINFRVIGAENPDHVFPTAPCVIDSFNVDRTGGDYPSFFKNSGTPVVYSIKMSVIEILPLIRVNNALMTISVQSLAPNLGVNLPS